MPTSFVTIQPSSGTGPSQLRIVAKPHTGRKGRDELIRAFNTDTGDEAENVLLIHQKGIDILDSDLSVTRDISADTTSFTEVMFSNYEYLWVTTLTSGLELTGVIINDGRQSLQLNSIELSDIVNPNKGYRVKDSLGNWDPGAEKYYTVYLSFQCAENTSSSSKMLEYQINGMPGKFDQAGASDGGDEQIPQMPTPIIGYNNNTISIAFDDGVVVPTGTQIFYRVASEAGDESGDSTAEWTEYTNAFSLISSDQGGYYRAYAEATNHLDSAVTELLCEYDSGSGDDEGDSGDSGSGDDNPPASVIPVSFVGTEESLDIYGNLNIFLNSNGEVTSTGNVLIDVEGESPYEWTVDCIAPTSND